MLELTGRSCISNPIGNMTRTTCGAIRMVQALTHILAVASSWQLWIGRLAWQIGGDRVDISLQMRHPWLALEGR